YILILFFFQAEDGIRDRNVTGVQTCALPICGILLNFKTPIWTLDFNYNWSVLETSVLLFSIIIGTTLAFLLYIGSLKYITSQEAGILGVLEPVMAVLTTVIVLGDVLELFQILGITLILGITIFNTISSKKEAKA